MKISLTWRLLTLMALYLFDRIISWDWNMKNTTFGNNRKGIYSAEKEVHVINHFWALSLKLLHAKTWKFHNRIPIDITTTAHLSFMLIDTSNLLRILSFEINNIIQSFSVACRGLEHGSSKDQCTMSIQLFVLSIMAAVLHFYS